MPHYFAFLFLVLFLVLQLFFASHYFLFFYGCTIIFSFLWLLHNYSFVLLVTDDIFDDQNIFMQEFFPESTFTDCPFTAQNDPTYFSSVEPQNPLPGATSSILGSVAHGSLPMTQHPSPMSSPGSLQKTPPYEHSGYLQDGYSSPDSGFNSPDSLTSPTIDACEWKNDARSQVRKKKTF